MPINMNDEHLSSVDDLAAYVKGAGKMKLKNEATIDEKYQWVEKTLTKFRYTLIKRKARGVVRKYIQMVTEYSQSQLTKLIRKKKKKGKLKRSTVKRNQFETRYGPEDIALLVKTDNVHSRIAGLATKKILERECDVFGKIEYETIKNISVSHLYNLRQTRQYVSASLTFEKTNPTDGNIGERRKPRPEGKPGYIKVDSVHQGDQDKEKGVYHINLVDEVTQCEIVGCVEGISEYFLEPLLEKLLAQFPFVIINFHSDNGSEYINHTVAKLLQKLLVEQTKSRPRHSNDNALVEGKNASRIRKHMGHAHIPKKFAKSINDFYENYFNIYLNFHRPCGFATNVVIPKGKITKKYDTYMTPYQKLRSLEKPEQYLKPGITFEQLDKIAHEYSDNDWAQKMQSAKLKLFASFRKC